ncbi:MAG: hypothetical protein FWG22_01475, partial [Prolixibacteraceae bacterium]|nr:hypothetical protein [Prolixibacteraceae bacterium]
MKGSGFLYISVLSLLALVSGFARQQQNRQNQQNQEENRVLLISAHKFEIFPKDGASFRMISGGAKFLHNNTYILCDTAIWNQQDNIVDAKGHVQVIQDQTQLKGETLHYMGNDNLAQVRGPLVELFDSDGNRLRTKYLDFNTKDSIGIFYNGGSMVDSDGNVLESRNGHYYSKEKRFEFNQMVEMFTDTVLIKADFAQYQTDTRVVSLTGRVHAWHTDGYLRSEQSRYERDREFFRFFKNVYVQTDNQEVWADTLFFDRMHTKGSLYGNIQVLDTTQAIILLGDEGHFEQNPQKVLLTKDPVFITYGLDDNNVMDTSYVRGDTLRLVTLPRHKVDSAEAAAARTRLRQLLPPLPTPPQDTSSQGANIPPDDEVATAVNPLNSLRQRKPSIDSVVTPSLSDSLAQPQPLDSLAQPQPLDSLAQPQPL